MEYAFNIADIIVLAVLAFFIYFFYRKGLVGTLLGFCSTIISVLFSKISYPFVSDILRSTPVFDSIKAYVIETAGLSKIAEGAGIKAQTDFISSLNIPDFLKNALIDNNNSEVYKLLDVTTIEDYIGGYVASFLINIISMIIVFVVIWVAIKIISNTLNIVVKLPIIRTANSFGGAVLGFIQGTIVIWIAFAVLTLFFAKPVFQDINETISSSVVASKFYDSNILIKSLSFADNLA